MDRREFIMISAGMLASVAFADSGGEKNRHPNIVLLMAEDICSDLACYGTPGVKTPTIDALAAGGIRYNRFYTNSPICSPSRTSLMLGMYQTTCGGHNHRSRVKAGSADWHYMTHYLRKAGYTCLNGTRLIKQSNPKTDINVKLPEPLFGKGRRKEPFFHQIQLKVTHRDAGSNRWKELRKASKSPVKTQDIEVPPYLPDTPEVREDWATYLDQVEQADRDTQMVLDDLEKERLLDNTIVIWMGDNGRCQVRGKGYLYEDGIRCPLIISGKGIDPNKVVNDLVSGIDLTATILALAGIDKPAHMQGQAFLDNPDYTPKEHVFAARDRWDEIVDCSRAIVGRRYKYIHNFMPEVPYDAHQKYLDKLLVRPILPLLRKMNREGKLSPVQAYFFRPRKDTEQLYDLKDDPFELKNLADSPEHRARKNTLKQRLFKWIEESRDLGLEKGPDGKWHPVSEKGESGRIVSLQ